MNISAPFIRRPIATSLLTVALLLAGSLAYRMLPEASLPEIDFPTIFVYANLPGASPDTMASAVATPLERMFGRIAGITQMTSTSQLGSTNIILQFDLDRDGDAASRDVQAAINAARGLLPANLPTNPGWRKVNPAEAPVMVLTVTSDTATMDQMYDASDSILSQKIDQIPGIGQVQIGGSSQPAVRVEVNPMQLSSLNIGLDQVAAALNTANANVPKGQLANSSMSWVISDNDQLFTAAEYAKLIVGYNNGNPVRLSDVATVLDEFADRRNIGLSNGSPAVSLVLFRQPGANIVNTVDAVKATLPLLQASIPPSMQINIAQDRTTTIRASVKDVEQTLIIAICLVVLVVFLFLRSVWATVIPSIAVPLSLVGTFGVMYLLGYTLDNLSLMALTISTGFVVDDAIVVIENITRHLEGGGITPLQAALKGSQEIGFTVLSMSTSLVAVFIPILFMSGLVGRLFREFAITMTAAVAISLIVSLTTTPTMCAKFLKAEEKHGRFYRLMGQLWDRLQQGYASSLRRVLRHQRVVLAITLGTVCLAVYLYIVIPKGFFPQQDTGRLQGGILASQDISFPAMAPKLSEYMRILMQDPAIDQVTGSVGGGSVNQGKIQITLKPIEQRDATADQVINRLRGRLAGIPGAILFLQSVQDVQIGGRMGNAQYQYTLQGDNLQDLLQWAPLMEQKMHEIPSLRDIASDQQNHALEASLVIDRATAGRLGLTANAIDTALYQAFGQADVSTMYKGMNQYFVVMEADPKFGQSPDVLRNLYVRSSTGVAVPFSAFTHFEPAETYMAVAHQGQFPAVTLSFNLAPDTSLGDAVTAITAAQQQLIMPPTIHPGFQGTAQAFQDSLASEPLLILAAIVTVYIVLGILYENYVHPLTILSTLPSAGVGALLALLVFHTELTVIALIGILLLIGIVKKNAIMMIDFAIDAERNQGATPEESIYQACLLRFRPIMMTTMAAMFGGIPMALSHGNGAELRRPLGIAIVGGLLVSQMLTLYTTPVIYLYLDRFRAWVTGGKKMHRLATEEEVLSHGARPAQSAD
jgi:multidrug efflux pump